MAPPNAKSWSASKNHHDLSDQYNKIKNDYKVSRESLVIDLSMYQRCSDLISWCIQILTSILLFPRSVLTVLGYFGSYQRFWSLLSTAPLFNGICESDARLDGKTVVITGCTSGIGKETAMEFYKRGARVIMCCLSIEEAESTITDMENECINMTGLGKLVYTILDLSSLASVRRCGEEILSAETSVHVLVNNAGIMMTPKAKTVDGFESHFAVNYLGHFLLTTMLLPLLIKSKPARIVNLSSSVHFFGTINFNDLHYNNTEYCCFRAYAQSKLAIILFTKELARQFQANNIGEVTVHAVHPGVLCTRLGPHFDDLLIKGAGWMWYMIGRVALKNPKSGAQTTLHCALDETCAKETGLYYCDCSPQIPSEEARNQEVAKKLWDVSCQMVSVDKNRIDKLTVANSELLKLN